MPMKPGSRPDEVNRKRRGHNFYPPQAIMRKIPPVGSNQDKPLRDTVVHLHYFTGGSDWYISELDPHTGYAFGWACIGGDTQNAGWGVIYLPELEEVVINNLWVVERDMYFDPQRFDNTRHGKGM